MTIDDDPTADIWTDQRLDDLIEWLEEAYPEEGCALILQDEKTGDYRVLRTENLADKYHEMDPEQFPRTAEKFYIIDPMEFMKAEDRGERVAVVVHSHVDVGDYFSEEDVDAATMPRDDDDEPLEESHPGVDYLVVAVDDGRANHATLFRFDPSQADGDHPYPGVLEIDIAGETYELSSPSPG